MHPQRVAGHHHEGRHVLRDMALKAGHGVGPDVAELMDARQAAHDHPIPHVHMAGEGGVVGQDGVRAHLNVVRQMHIGHDPVVVTQAGDARVLDRAAVEGAELPDGVAVADVQGGGFAAVLHVLRRTAQHGVCMDAVVAADDRGPLDDAMGPHLGACADGHARADQRIGADGDVLIKLCLRIDKGRRVDPRHLYLRPPGAWCTSTPPPPPTRHPRWHGPRTCRCPPWRA